MMKFSHKARKSLIFTIAVFSLMILSPFFSANLANGAETSTGNTVIIMIGDGMGPQQVEFGRLVEYGPDGTSIINEFPNKNTVNTNNIDGTTTDSAASGTAIASGIKTRNGRIGTNFNAKVDSTSILEIAEEKNYNTGLIATCHMTHATPAAFAAHDASRNNYQAIAADMAQSGTDLIFGGGSDDKYFGLQIDSMKADGYAYIENKEQLKATNSLPVLGLFQEGSLSEELDRDDTLVPSLSLMTEKAIELLDAKVEPFFLMVEGSQIDWAGHANDPEYLVHEMIEFEKAVRIAKSYADAHNDVQLIVTADHECGGLKINSYEFTTNMPTAGNTLAQNRTARVSRALQIDVSYSTGGHTKTEVPLVGMGPYSDRIASAEHHIDTFSMMRMAIEGKQGPVSDSLYAGEEFYEGYINILWLYIPGGIAAAALLGFIIYKIVKVVKKKKMA
jgi:alkaline phosphatase